MKTSHYLFLTFLATLISCSNMTAQGVFKDASIILEGGSFSTQVHTVNQLFNNNATVLREERPNRFTEESPGWKKSNGFTTGIKFASSINPQIFDSNVSLDFITGIVYKESNLTQENYSEHNNLGSGGFLVCFEFFSYREINIQSIEIPMELRTNFQVGKFSFSPILGLAVDVPINKTHDLYYPDYNDSEITRGDHYATEEFESKSKFNYSAISKIEVAYQLPNQHKIKFSGVYNIYLNHALGYQLSSAQGVSTKGLQLAYEIPLSNQKI